MPKLSNDQWQQILERFEQSDLTQAEFAKCHSLNLYTFRGRLYRSRSSSPRRDRTKSFVELEFRQESPSAELFSVECGQLLLSFSKYPDPRWLAQLAQSLGAL